MSLTDHGLLFAKNSDRDPNEASAPLITSSIACALPACFAV